MKKYILYTILVFCIGACGQQKEGNPPPDLEWMKNGNSPLEYKNGDILFIHSQSDLSGPISLATESEYTHCGVYWIQGLDTVVLEAASVSEATPFREFLESREGKLLLVLRLNQGSLYTDVKSGNALRKKLKGLLGKEYDGYFEWSDERMYCSELVYKIYALAGITLCEPKKLREYDLSSNEVKQELQERYGDNVPLDEPMVAPVDLIYSSLLDTVFYTR